MDPFASEQGLKTIKIMLKFFFFFTFYPDCPPFISRKDRAGHDEIESFCWQSNVQLYSRHKTLK